MHKPGLAAVLVVFVLMAAGCATEKSPRTAETGAMLDRSVNGCRYAVWRPEGYDTARDWPVIVFLHGKGECGTDGKRQTEVGLGPALRREPARWPFVVLMPQKPDKESAWEEHVGMVMVELNEVRREFRIDEQRVYLTGLSQGGHGTWAIAALEPSAWAAIAPVCGYGDPVLGAAVAGLPIWAFHGARDDVRPAAGSVALVEAARAERVVLGAEGPEPRLTIYPEANHNSWDRAYAEAELPRWLLSQQRGLRW